MLDHSYKSDFSPPIGPWGWPLILAIPIRIVGLNIDQLFFVSLALYVLAMATWYWFALERVSRLTALFGLLAIGTSPIYIDWTELLHTELPFMVFVFATLIVIDRNRGRWSTSWTRGALAGVLAAAAFSTRREGLALVGVIGLALIADRAFADRDRRWVALTPYAAFGSAVLLLQLVLPSTLVPNYPANTVWNLFRYANVIAQRIGEIVGFDNSVIGWLVVSLGFVGWAMALRSDWRKHAPIAGYLLAVMVIGGSFFVPSGRYFSTAVPLLILGALMIPTRDHGSPSRLATLLVILVFAPVVYLNGVKAVHEGERANQFNGVIKEGPNRSDAVEMFAAVRTETADVAVIGFFKARSMTLYTDRRAVQIDEADPLNPDSEFDVLVVRSDEVDEEDRLAIDGDYLVEWSNETFEVLTHR
ncbi:MAG: glycosyltransferase family 39 protein [Acidimicrobiia bacterium]|nr:glycosyltransferase family 39 protein [Acidimicrobiia bacterium]